jgi:hypothetical protein
MFLINRFIRGLFKFAAAITSILLSLGAFAGSPSDILDETHAAVQAVMAVQEEVTPSLMERPEILGTRSNRGDPGAWHALGLSGHISRR